MSAQTIRLVALAALALNLQGAATVRLERWQGKAVDIPLRGPGVEQMRLRAVVRWSGRASGAYSVRVALPDGSTATHPVEPDEAPGSRRLTVLVPAASVRNLRPDRVKVAAVVVEAAGGAVVSNRLEATIDDFPTPKTPAAAVDRGPFGWGRPLRLAPRGSAPLPRPGPDGFRFVLNDPGPPGEVFGIAATEATNEQVRRRLPGHDPRAGRSDEFLLEDAGQPAINLTPKQATAYLRALGKADRSGLTYRLPTAEEWDLAARAGRTSAFWWGDEPANPAGANFLGPEPALPTDTTATARLEGGTPGFRPNPRGLFHTFGNAAEWATRGRSLARMGGHFRTEPASPLPAEEVDDPDSVGPDAFVGVRPAFRLSAEEGVRLARRQLDGDPALAGVRVAFDPRRATATLAGTVADPSLRRVADRRLAALWFLAAVEDRIESPTIPPGGLARLGPPVGKARRIMPLGRAIDEVPVEVRWAAELPVTGSDWWVNLYPAAGGHLSHRLVGGQPDESGRVAVLVDRANVPANGPVAVALSLGAPAPSPTDARVVSNLLSLTPPAR